MENVLVVDQFVVGFVLNYTAFIALGKHDKGKNKVKKQRLLAFTSCSRVLFVLNMAEKQS